MSPAVSKDALLDAAEAIVCEAGAAHMTLDGVAERAHVSKGGLMYRFPTKAALLQAMVARHIENIEELRAQVRQESSEAEPNDLVVEIKMLSRLDEMGSRPTAALLATIANQPELMDPFRDELRRRCADRILAGSNPQRSTILFLAALGLHFATLLSVSFLDQEHRENVYQDLLRLAANEKETL